MRRIERSANQRLTAIVTHNGRDITDSIPLNYLEVENRTEPALGGGGINHWEEAYGTLRMGFYHVSVSENDINTMQQVPTAEVHVYPNPDSTSYIKFMDAQCYSYIAGEDMDFVGARELELSWAFRGTMSQQMDWLQFKTPKTIPLEKISWQKLGF